MKIALCCSYEMALRVDVAVALVTPCKELSISRYSLHKILLISSHKWEICFFIIYIDTWPENRCASGVNVSIKKKSYTISGKMVLLLD